MKKVLSLFLVVALCISLCGCQNEIQKQIEFKHSEIYAKSISLTIPDEWSYIEILNMEEQILFNLTDSEDNVVASGLASSQDVSKKQPLIDIVTVNSDEKKIEINEDVFCSFSKNKNMPYFIYVRVSGDLLIISFRDIDENTVERIAKTITFKDIEENA